MRGGKRAALPALKEAVEDPKIRVRAAARSALREVGRPPRQIPTSPDFFPLVRPGRQATIR
ncbi:MAG: hypothetical protein ACRD2T_07240 [Thermoanaerobaculia bacterium]